MVYDDNGVEVANFFSDQDAREYAALRATGLPMADVLPLARAEVIRRQTFANSLTHLQKGGVSVK